MTRRLLTVIMAIMLVATWVGFAAAGEAYSLKKIYNMDRAEEGFVEPPKGEARASAVMADAAIGRPLGLATTLIGTGVFLVNLPFTVPSQSVDTAAWGLVGRPGGWTFNRPLGKGKPEYEEKSIFR